MKALVSIHQVQVSMVSFFYTITQVPMTLLLCDEIPLINPHFTVIPRIDLCSVHVEIEDRHL